MKSELVYHPWKVLVSADSMQVAMLMVSYLQSEGIEARVDNQQSVQYQIVGFGRNFRGARVEVREGDLQRAAALLDERQSTNYRIPDEALAYWPATRQELEAQIAANTPASGPLFPNAPWYKIAAACALIGVVFGASGWLEESKRSRGNQGPSAILTLASAAAMLGLGVSAWRSKSKKSE